MVKIKKQLINDTPYKYKGINKKKFITIHETDNWSKGAGAQAHANLQSNGNSRNASWHWQVDDKQAIQSFTHDFQLWAGGDGKGNGNLNSIHIEICVNPDSDFNKAVQNAAELTKKIMNDEKISVGNVVQHNHWSGKHCPRFLRDGNKGVTWAQFKKMLSGQPKVTYTPNSVKSNNPSSPKPTGKLGLVDWMKSKGMDSSYNNRSKLAKKHGIKGYNGTESQNIKLLGYLQSGSKPTPKKNTNKNTGFKKGQKVTVKKSAKQFATGEPMANHVKGSTYKIIQVKSDRVLLDNIMSWVKKTDIVGYTSTAKTEPAKKSTATLPSGVLKRGNRGNKVKQLQRALNNVNFKVGKVDGIYGAKTEDAVRRFQMVYDAYRVDGVYGSRTKSRLEKLLK